MGFQATTEWDLLKGTGSPWFNRDYIPSPASPQLPALRSKLPNHLLLLPKGLDLAKQRSYKGVSQVQAQILTCVNGEFGTARLSEQLFGFLLLSFLEREGEWITSKSRSTLKRSQPVWCPCVHTEAEAALQSRSRGKGLV